MNHRIKQKKPRKPVIVCQDDETITEANTFELSYDGKVIGHVVFDPSGLDACETHDVKAWVEVNDKVDVHAIGKLIVSPRKPRPVAKAKAPNKPIVQVGLFD